MRSEHGFHKWQSIGLMQIFNRMTNWIYSNSPDNKERHILGEKGDNSLICVRVNPSTAESDNLDPTLIQVRNRAK